MEFLNVELTSKCALACPRCSRTYSRGSYEVTELPVQLIQDRFESPILSGLKWMVLSGNYGDAIYHTHFHEVIAYLKHKAWQIGLETNGTGRDRSWWREVGEILDHSDQITFALDGLEDTLGIYRKGAVWADIMAAVDELRGKVGLTWKFIIFKHNQHQIEEAQSLARHLGFQRFKLVRSHLFGPHWLKSGEAVDPLMPDSRFRIERPSLPKNQEIKISPRCIKESLHHVSASGYYFPCCWIGNRHELKNTFLGSKLEQLSLHRYSFEEILQSDALRELSESWKQPAHALPACVRSCGNPKHSSDDQRSNHSIQLINFETTNGSG